MDYASMTTCELKEEHARLLRVNKSCVRAGETETARAANSERYKVWKELDSRGQAP